MVHEDKKSFKSDKSQEPMVSVCITSQEGIYSDFFRKITLKTTIDFKNRSDAHVLAFS